MNGDECWQFFRSIDKSYAVLHEDTIWLTRCGSLSNWLVEVHASHERNGGHVLHILDVTQTDFPFSMRLHVFAHVLKLKLEF